MNVDTGRLGRSSTSSSLTCRAVGFISKMNYKQPGYPGSRGDVPLAATEPLRLLTRRDVAGLLGFADYVGAVEQAFRLLAEAKADAPAPLHLHGDGVRSTSKRP